MSLPDRSQHAESAVSTADIDKILSALPHLRRGPGGVAAILLKGEVVGQRSWGYADLEKRIPMTSKTHFPICSISKQMVCLTMLSLLRKPTPRMLERKEDPAQQLEDELHRLLPGLSKDKTGEEITVANLFNMQSGIRDYWAMSTLWGAHPDGQFSILHDAPQALERTKSFHFAPGTEYSYSNVNFHVLGKVMENVSGMSLAQLLTDRLFIPAGMSTAALCPNTIGLPLPIVGYEGNETVGYFKATNRIEWAGDAGIAASLEDMIAYERYLDASLLDSSSLYSQTSQQQHFKDGTPAAYGYGLSRGEIAGKTAIAHGGALRGFRHLRLQIPSERLNVVVFHNHEEPGGANAEYIVEQMLGWKEPTNTVSTLAPEWKGDYLDPNTQLSITVKNGDAEKPGTLCIRYGPGTSAETVKLTSANEAQSESMKIRVEGDMLHAEMIDDNRKVDAKRIPVLDDLERFQAPSADYVGGYRCEEMDTTITITGDNGTLYGSFEGFLGKGPVWLMRCIGKDVWALGNPRGLDATPPGDWTVVFERGKDGGKVTGCTVGCWLARKVVYSKLQ